LRYGYGYSAAERLERLPISGYHRVIFIIIALAFFFDSMDLAMMTFLLGSIKAEFGLSTAQAGLRQFELFRHGGGRVAVRNARRPLRAQAGVPVEHRVVGLASYLCSTAQTVET
jgi:putative MFS transporter